MSPWFYFILFLIIVLAPIYAFIGYRLRYFRRGWGEINWYALKHGLIFLPSLCFGNYRITPSIRFIRWHKPQYWDEGLKGEWRMIRIWAGFLFVIFVCKPVARM